MSRPKLRRDPVAWLYDPLVGKLSFGRARRFRVKTMELLELPPTDHEPGGDVGLGTMTRMIATRLAPEGQSGINAASKRTKETDILTVQRLAHLPGLLSCRLATKPLVAPPGGSA